MWINSYDNFDAAAPFGGFKQSGHGRTLRPIPCTICRTAPFGTKTNPYTPNPESQIAPFGGFKQSGHGTLSTPTPFRDGYFIAEQPAPALHLVHIQTDVLPYALC